MEHILRPRRTFFPFWYGTGRVLLSSTARNHSVKDNESNLDGRTWYFESKVIVSAFVGVGAMICGDTRGCARQFPGRACALVGYSRIH